MRFFQELGHSGAGVIKRTPPPRFIKLLKNSWQPDIEYTSIFNAENSISSNSGRHASTSTADLEHSVMLSPFQWKLRIAHDSRKSDSEKYQLRIKDELPLKKIDPAVIKAALATVPKVKQKILINLINHIHFTKEQISIHLKNKQTDEEFLQQGEPRPYLNDQVTIRFVDPQAFDLNLHVPLNIIIDNRKSLIVFPIDLQSVNHEELQIKLPETAYAYSKRQAVRHVCEGIQAEVVQGQISAWGFLEDINFYNLRVRLSNEEDFNPNIPLFVKLSQNTKTYFFGECRIIRNDKEGADLILEPLRNNRPVLKTRKHPNKRVKITPQPIIRFVHPFCGLALQHKIEDISTSGFSVIVPDRESLLIPGMVIPQLTLHLPGMFNHLTCTVQVIYRRKQRKEWARYGFYILDMALHEQRLLYDAVTKVVDPHVNLTGKVNLDSLWELFFDSGFIYPDKYGIISPHKEDLKETYRKLYDEGQEIFTHLTYQDQGQIYGHMSMVKAYEDSWIIHHLAARPMRGKRTGLKTLNHFVDYIDCLYRLPVSSKTMRYNFCYYRPENSFSDYYFGGICKTLKRREICSLDLFGYMSMKIELTKKKLPAGWSIEPLSQDDLMIMRNYYNGLGGGLMLNAFALEYRVMENDEIFNQNVKFLFKDDYSNIRKMYQRVGLHRDSKVYAIRYEGTIKAALIVDTSDLGINMSELLNSIKVIVMDRDLPWKILQDVVSELGSIYGSEK